MGRKFRAHSVAYVLGHICQVREQYRIKHIHFEDDNFSFDMARFNEILDGMISSRCNITWDTPNGVRADYLNENILQKCKESGCTYLRIGVESANEAVSKKIVRKHLNITTVKDVAKFCRNTGIDLEAFYIIGLPGETVSQMNETIDFAIRQERCHGMTPSGLFTATPLIGTDLYKLCIERGYITSELSSNNIAKATQGEGMISTEDFSPDILKILLTKDRKRHLIAKVIYSLKFIILHPCYLMNRLTTPYYLKHVSTLIREKKLLTMISEVFFYRYKNCVVRKVGIP